MKTTFNHVEIADELTGEPLAYAALEMKLREDGSIDPCDAAQSIYDIMCRDSQEVPAYLEIVSENIRWEALIVDDVICTSDHVLDKHYFQGDCESSHDSATSEGEK